MKLIEEVKEVIEIRIKEEVLADKIFEKGVMKALNKLVEVIPTEIDDALLYKYKSDLKAEFIKGLGLGIDFLEEKTGLELDGEK